MNKNLKKIIAIALVIGTISAVGSVTKINLLTRTAYASSNNNDIDKLYSLRVETQSGSGIKLYYDSGYKNYSQIDYDAVENDHMYYTETSSDTIKLEPNGPDSKYIRVFNGTSDSTKGEDINNNIKLSPGTNIITVRVYKEEPDKYVEYEDEGKVESTYIININYTPNSTVDEDVINLKSLTVNEDEISLSESQATYTYNVADNINTVSIKAKPEDDDYQVTIAGDDVDENDNYEKSVKLDNGENDIEIELKDNSDNDREYILKINKGDSTIAVGSTTGTSNAAVNSQSGSAVDTASTASKNNAATTVIKTNQWIQTNGRWLYNDSNGNPIKNAWFFDKNYGKWYYLGADGFMEENCWVLSGSKYYYLNADGSMAANTTINGYKVGADGAWIS